MSDKLKADSLSFFESIIMGVAGSAPGFSIAVAISGLLTTAGFFSPNAVLIFAGFLLLRSDHRRPVLPSRRVTAAVAVS